MAENQLTSAGANPVIKSATLIVSLNLAKNELDSDVGKYLCQLLRRSEVLEKLHLEYNALEMVGTR